MKLKIVLFVTLMVVLVACRTDNAGNANETMVLTPVNTPILATSPASQLEDDTTPTQDRELLNTTDTDVIRTNTSTIGNTIQQPNTAVPSAAEPVPQNIQCTVQTNLPVYTVVAGDTLFEIASRANMSVDDIVRINCLPDRNTITVGQQLYVTAAIPLEDNTSDTTNENTTQVVGTVIMPYQINTGNTYVVNTNTTLTLQWMGMPTDLGLTEVEFMFRPDRVVYAPISLGIDNDLSDGAMIQLNYNNANVELRGTIFVGGVSPVTRQNVLSESIRVEPDNRPMRVGPRGALSVDPNIQAGTPDDWSDYIVEAGQTVTIRWTGVDPNEYNTLTSATLYFYPDDGGDGQIWGRDSDHADGLDFIWIVPNNTSGKLTVEGIIDNSSRLVFSPNLHVRTSDTTPEACHFNPFGIGGDIPVYDLADTDSTQIGVIQTGTTYPVLSTGGTWSTEFGGAGKFYQISLGVPSGWVQDGRGELIGDCSEIPTHEVN